MVTSEIVDPGEPALPPEPADGTWLHVPDLHGEGYIDVMRRDDFTAYGDPARAQYDERWYSYHRRAWVSWKDAVRLGAATARALQLVDPALHAAAHSGGFTNPAAAADAARGVAVDPRSVDVFGEYGR